MRTQLAPRIRYRKKKKILIFAKSIDGGTGSFVLSLQKLNKISDMEIVNKTIVLESPLFRKVNSKFTYLRAKNYYPKNYGLSPGAVINFFEEIIYFSRNVAKFQPDVVVGVDVHCNLIAGIVKILIHRNVKLILTTHINLRGSLSEKGSSLLNFVIQKAVSVIYQVADNLVAVSAATATSLKKDFKINKKIETIYYGVTEAGKNSKPLFKGKNRVVLSIGRLVDQKDFSTLLSAFKLVNKVSSNVELWIVGDGPQRQELEELVKKYSLEKSVKFWGWQQDSSSFLKTADIFVLSTKREGFPYVLLEALAQNKPVISSNAKYGPSEILEKGKYGILVPVGDINALSKSILKLVKSKYSYNYYVQKSKERSKDFSERKMLKEYSQMIFDLLAE